MKQKLAKKLGIVQVRQKNYREIAAHNKSHVFEDRRYKRPRYKEDYRYYER